MSPSRGTEQSVLIQPQHTAEQPDHPAPAGYKGTPANTQPIPRDCTLSAHKVVPRARAAGTPVHCRIALMSQHLPARGTVPKKCSTWKQTRQEEDVLQKAMPSSSQAALHNACCVSSLQGRARALPCQQGCSHRLDGVREASPGGGCSSAGSTGSQLKGCLWQQPPPATLAGPPSPLGSWYCHCFLSS